MNNLATAMPTPARTTGRSKLREEALALRKAKLGPDHPDTLTSMNNLAISYAAAGQNDRALKLFEETLALRKAKLGPDHPETLTEHEQPRHQLRRRRPERPGAEAPRGDAGAAEGEARPRPPRHAHQHEQPRLQSMPPPARTTGRSSSRGDPGAAEGEARARPPPHAREHEQPRQELCRLPARTTGRSKLFEETLALQKAKLGPDHPDTLWSMNNLALQLCRRRPERPGAEAPRGDPGALHREARPRPPSDGRIPRSPGPMPGEFRAARPRRRDPRRGHRVASQGPGRRPSPTRSDPG